MELSKKQIAVGLIATCALGVAIGRFAGPQKVEEHKTSTTQINKEVKTQIDRDKRVEKQIKVLVRPDGTREEITSIVETSTTQKKQESETEGKKTESQSKLIEYAKQKTSIAVLAGPNIGDLSGGMFYGVHGSYQLLGPISVGVFGFTDGRTGISAGLSF